MKIEFDVVVSCENTKYMAWQAQLFCFSATTRLNLRPIVVVHQTSEPLRPEFRQLQALGFPLIQAPSFVYHRSGALHPPRNELGTLLKVATQDGVRLNTDHILLCETDMIFVRPLEFVFSPAGEFYTYLQYSQPRIRLLAERVGLSGSIESLDAAKVGVPYLIPKVLAQDIACRWFEMLDAFESLEWIDMMYAFGLATASLGLHAKATHVMNTNVRPQEPVTGSFIHYCYGNDLWDKRWYLQAGSPFETPNDVAAGGSGTILGEISKQIHEAKEYFAPPDSSLHSRRRGSMELCTTTSAVILAD